MAALIFSDDLLWNWAREVARISRNYPERSVEQIADDVMAVVTVAKVEERKS